MIFRSFRKQIEDIINQSGLPIDAVYFVIKDIYNEVTEVYSNEIAKEEEEARRAFSENAEGVDQEELDETNGSNEPAAAQDKED
jgi:hypothetical protein